MSDRDDGDDFDGYGAGRGRRSGEETSAQLSRLRAGLKRGLAKRGEARRQAAEAAADLVSSRRRPIADDGAAARPRREDLGAQPHAEDFDETDPDAVAADDGWGDDGAARAAGRRRSAGSLDDDDLWRAAAAASPLTRRTSDGGASPAVDDDMFRDEEPADVAYDWDDDDWEAEAERGRGRDGTSGFRRRGGADRKPLDPAPPRRSPPRRVAAAVAAARAEATPEDRFDDGPLDEVDERRRGAFEPDDGFDDNASLGDHDDASLGDHDDASLHDEALYDAPSSDAPPRRAAAGRMSRARVARDAQTLDADSDADTDRHDDRYGGRSDSAASRDAVAEIDDAAPAPRTPFGRRKPLRERETARPERRPDADEPRRPEADRKQKAGRDAKRRVSGRAAASTAAAAAGATDGRRRGGAGAFSGLERTLSFRYLRARREEGFISVIAFLSLVGIVLGVATLIIVMSVMNGFRSELVSRIVGVNGHLTVTDFGQLFDDYDEVAAAIEGVPGVVRAAPIIEEGVFAVGPRSRTGALVRGVAPEDLLTLERVAVTPEAAFGSLAAFGQTDGIALGEGMARRLDLSVGDTISLIYDRGAATPFGVAPRRRAYEVLYIFKTGMFQFDNGMIFMPLDEAQTFFNRQGVADGVEVMVATPDDLTGYRDDIDAAVGRPLAYSTWQERNGAFIGALNTERSVMFIILSLLILIASLIIISGMIMLVKEKAPDIAILRTMGASRGAILRVFFMCGAAIGVVGAALGVALGVVIALNIQDIKSFVDQMLGYDTFSEEIYLLSNLPSQLHWEDVGLTVAITLSLSFLATLYPAWRAAKLDPVEGLRNG